MSVKHDLEHFSLPAADACAFDAAMGSDFFKVRVLGTQKNLAQLEVDVVHPDVGGVPTDVGVVLMLLREGAPKDSPLAQAIGERELVQPAWAEASARGFIVKVVAKKKTKRSGTLEIEVTDPAWVAHLKKGLKWTSAAYQVATRYADCEPIRPDDEATDSDAKPTPTAGPGPAFLYCHKQVLGSYAQPSDPDLCLVMAYDPNRYDVIEKVAVKKLSPAKLASWLGRPVELTDGNGNSARGTLLGVDQIARVGERGVGTMGVGKGDTLGLLVPGKNLAKQRPVLTYAHLFAQAGEAGASVTKATVKGKEALLGLSLWPDATLPPIKTATDALWAIALPLMEPYLDPPNGSISDDSKAPLAVALRAERKARGFRFPLYPGLASSFIEHFGFTTEVAPIALSSLTFDEVRAAYARRKTCTLLIRATAAKWVSHLPKTERWVLHREPKDPPIAST